MFEARPSRLFVPRQAALTCLASLSGICMFADRSYQILLDCSFLGRTLCLKLPLRESAVKAEKNVK